MDFSDLISFAMYTTLIFLVNLTTFGRINAAADSSVPAESEDSCANSVCSYTMAPELSSKGCVFVYSNEDSCCPIGHVCPEEYVPIQKNKVCKDPSSTTSTCMRQGFTFNSELNICFPGACPLSNSENFFLTPKECVDKCVSDYDYNICLQETAPGACYANMMRYYYNKTSNSCHMFRYYGCKGNMNNFLTQDDCMKQCKDYKIGFCNFGSQRLPKGFIIKAKDPCITCVCTSNPKQRSAMDNRLFCIKKTCPEQPAGCTIRPQILGNPTCCPTYACPGRDDRSSDFLDDTGTNNSKSISKPFLLVAQCTAIVLVLKYSLNHR